LLMVIEGTLHIGENGWEWSLSPGDTLLFHPNGEHYSVEPCKETTTFYWVHFEHTGMSDAMEKKKLGALYASRQFGNPHMLSLDCPLHERKVWSNPNGVFL